MGVPRALAHVPPPSSPPLKALHRIIKIGFDFRHSRESGNPEYINQALHLKSNAKRSQRIPSPLLAPVIPAKAGIQSISTKLATRNQAPTEANGSLPPLRGKARMGVSRALARVPPPVNLHLQNPIKGEEICRSPFVLDFRRRAWFRQPRVSTDAPPFPLYLPRRSRSISPDIPAFFPPVIPAKAGIQRVESNFAIRNQA